jgi:hypothetical protein
MTGYPSSLALRYPVGCVHDSSGSPSRPRRHVTRTRVSDWFPDGVMPKNTTAAPGPMSSSIGASCSAPTLGSTGSTLTPYAVSTRFMLVNLHVAPPSGTRLHGISYRSADAVARLACASEAAAERSAATADRSEDAADLAACTLERQYDQPAATSASRAITNDATVMPTECAR